MDTVDMNFRVLQSLRTRDGEEWNDGRSQTRYDEYEWRDYYRNKIGGDGPPRYQLWKNDRWTYETFDRNSMEADKQRMIEAAWAAERAATKGGLGGHKDVRMLLDELREVNAVNFRGV